jgi:amino acid permease
LKSRHLQMIAIGEWLSLLLSARRILMLTIDQKAER